MTSLQLAEEQGTAEFIHHNRAYSEYVQSLTAYLVSILEYDTTTDVISVLCILTELSCLLEHFVEESINVIFQSFLFRDFC